MVEYTHFHIIQLWTAKTSLAQSDEFDEFFFTDNQIKAKTFKFKRDRMWILTANTSNLLSLLTNRNG